MFLSAVRFGAQDAFRGARPVQTAGVRFLPAAGILVSKSREGCKFHCSDPQEHEKTSVFTMFPQVPPEYDHDDMHALALSVRRLMASGARRRLLAAWDHAVGRPSAEGEAAEGEA